MFSCRNKLSEYETSLLERASISAEFPSFESLNEEALRQLMHKEGVDFATALLFDRLQKSAAHSNFIQQINALRQRSSEQNIGIDAKMVIVPGALYLERPDMGGDGRLVREVAESLGLETDLIPLASFGSVTTNARLICDWMRQHAQEKIILVSLSKGGADLKLALSSSEAAHLFQNVIAWVNVCGPLNGSNMANWVLASHVRTWFFRLKLHWQKRDFHLITDLRHGKNSLLDFPFQTLPSMKMVNLIGFPLRHHMTTSFSRFCHRTLAAHGPNDGTTLLADLCKWPGKIYPAWGMDHYFRPKMEAENLIASVIQYLADSISL